MGWGPYGDVHLPRKDVLGMVISQVDLSWAAKGDSFGFTIIDREELGHCASFRYPIPKCHSIIQRATYPWSLQSGLLGCP